MKKTIIIILIVISLPIILFRIFCGIYVTQPIGMIPDGMTIVYWRNGTDLPFISSADGILQKSGKGVSILNRIMTIGEVSGKIKEKVIFRMKYSEKLYLISTDGKRFER